GRGDQCLVAYVVPDDPGRPPTLTELRAALWARLPGALWPAEVVYLDHLPTQVDAALPVPGRPASSPPDTLTAMWAEIGGKAVRPDSSYWQDFSFLQALSEAREAGVGIPWDYVARCRT